MTVEDKKLLVVRGVPGSGKTTFLEKTAPSARVCSADHHFIGPGGVYRFNPGGLATAHNECWRKFSLVLGVDNLIAIDNTNLTWSEMGRYVETALAAGYKVEVIDFQVKPELAANRNVHGVPVDKVMQMATRQLSIPESIKANPDFTHILFGENLENPV